MLFNSVEFLLFFPTVTALYFALPHRLRAAWLLAASCVFYAAFIPRYLIILAFTIAVDFVAGLAIERSTGRARKLWLVASIVANLGVLATFKYWNFAAGSLGALLGAAGLRATLPASDLVLPIGLSFHTFQSISYTVEVHRGRQRAERDLAVFALYVLFWPQLVAGPIERPQNMLHQFHERHALRHADVAQGLRRMLWGFVKKIVVADRLAVAVDQVFQHASGYTGLPLIVATYFFTIQIYCDFSGYSDIALGAAQVMGFRLMTNFDRPYGASSVGEFWRRWHISLSTWFRDYVYIPLGGSRGSRWQRWRNVTVVFLLSGLWHGASWTFVAWGALHGAYLLLGDASRSARARVAAVSGLASAPALHGALRVVVTFHLVAFAWILFRAASLADAAHVATHLLDLRRGTEQLGAMGLSRFELILSAACGVGVVAAEALGGAAGWGRRIATWPVGARWAAYQLAVASIVLIGRFSRQQFIYFQF